MPRTKTSTECTAPACAHLVPTHVMFAIGAAKELRRRKLSSGLTYTSQDSNTYLITEHDDKFVVEVIYNANALNEAIVHNEAARKKLADIGVKIAHTNTSYHELKKVLADAFPTGKPSKDDDVAKYEATIERIKIAEERLMELLSQKEEIESSILDTTQKTETFEVSK